MQEKYEVLGAFLKEKYDEAGLTFDPEIVRLLAAHIDMEPRPLEESEEVRSIKVEEDSEGKKIAKSFKLWNITQVRSHDLLLLIGKQSGQLFFEDNYEKAAYGLLVLLGDFATKLYVDFNPQDSRIIYLLGKLDVEFVLPVTIGRAYKEEFGEVLPEERLQASLQALVKTKVIREVAPGQYQVREKIKNLRR